MSAPDDDVTRLAPPGPAVETPATRKGRADSSPSGWLSSSGAIDHGRFPPGTLLGGRYRIVGRLGRGGMGEVYRADDLKLGQTVALKFLPPEVDADPARLTQLHTEVRMARQVSHPNVCRVYDIDEVDGQTFLSMEYVDGEDLASLLRRIGRFSPGRAVELARQLCAGLAAAHERGVVHRDLKPSNVMVDSTGKIRIADFGLAGAAGEAVRAGTPAYMAPEQLAGAEVTPRSDIYALGLVLFEIFTGERAIEAKNVAELLRKREEGIIPPSQIVPDLDPSVDRAVLRCLEDNPADRPPSALAVAAALPGGDPLAVALAAGETPSPEMVAASGGTSALAPVPAVVGLLLTLGFLVAFAAITDRALITSYVPLDKPPAVLADRARAITERLGYAEAPVDVASGFSAAAEYLRYAIQRGDGAATRDRMRTGRPAGLLFWHRASPRPMVPTGMVDRVTRDNPPMTVSGMQQIVVDTEGRLVEFHAVPPEVEAGGAAADSADWDVLFEAAGLDPREFRQAEPAWTPPVHADERAAWEGPLPGWPEQRLRVEAAAHAGRPVFFRMINPWTQPTSMGETPTPRAQRVARTIIGIAIVAVLLVAVLVARHNLRKGRGDRRGAFRISSVIFAAALLTWITGSAHFGDVTIERNRLFLAIGDALFTAGMMWVLYLALEPYVRKLWPRTLVSWSRLIAGSYVDPHVGRAVLIGTLCGVTIVLLGRVDLPLRPLLGLPTLPPQVPSVIWLEGTRQMVAAIAQMMVSALFNSLWITFGVVAVNLIARRMWISALVMTLFLFLTTIGEIADAPPAWFSGSFLLAIVSAMVFVVVRFGLLATVTLFFVNFVLGSAVLTLDPSKWFFSTSVTLLLLVGALAVYGFYAARGGEPLLGRRLLE